MHPRRRLLVMGLALAIACAGTALAKTPSELVDTYETLATSILAQKRTEHNLVAAILATTYGHAEAALAKAKAKIASGGDARAELEELADLVGQLGNEGDAAVAAVRKKLVEAGHHHHAQAGDDKKYDEGFVIVTRAAKKVFLDAAGAIGKMAAKPDAAALDATWNTVREQYRELMKGA